MTSFFLVLVEVVKTIIKIKLDFKKLRLTLPSHISVELYSTRMNHQANNFSFSLNYLYTVKQKGAEKK